MTPGKRFILATPQTFFYSWEFKWRIHRVPGIPLIDAADEVEEE